MALCVNILLIGCATGASEISASYVSPAKYSGYDCDQINLERDSIERRVNGVGMVLFWPALFFLKGDSPEAAEYARMKGEYEAIQSVAIQKKCDIRFEKELMDTIDASKNNPNN